MTRSKWKPLFVDPILYFQIQEVKKINRNIDEKESLLLEVWSRSSLIIPQFRGSLLEIYNGQKFVPKRVEKKINGHKLGEFSLTKKVGPLIHILGKKKRKK